MLPPKLYKLKSMEKQMMNYMHHTPSNLVEQSRLCVLHLSLCP